MTNADLSLRRRRPTRLNRFRSLEAENKLLATEQDWRRRERATAREVHQAWSDVLARLPWQLFVTLTFDDRKVSSVSEDVASREAFEWLNLASRTYRSATRVGLWAERGQTGLWHVHALIIGVPVVRGEASTLPELCGVWEVRNGIINVERVHSRRGVAIYTTKQAAAAGTLVWADTLGRYREALQSGPTVKLWADDLSSEN